MFLNFGLLIDVLLFVGGIYWCHEVWGRRREDWAELREVDDATRKGVIIGIWVVTLIIALLVFNFAWGIGANIVAEVRGW